MTAYYHAGPPIQHLDLGHTVPIGEPWLPGSSCDHLLVSLPYPFGPDLESCSWDGGHARLLWMLPITDAEREYKTQNGLDALEERLEQAAVHPTDGGRPSVSRVPHWIGAHSECAGPAASSHAFEVCPDPFGCVQEGLLRRRQHRRGRDRTAANHCE